MQTKVGIVGRGWVGSAMKELFPKAYVYSRTKGKQEEINKCDVVFIAVPTPLNEDGTLDTAVVEYVISWIKAPLIVVRSTVNVGDCEMWSNIFGKKILFQPEYLGETPNHPLVKTKEQDFMIIGGRSNGDIRKLIVLYQSVYNANIKIRQLDLRTAEVVKLSENRAIAFKVAQMQELYDVCQKDKVDYYEVVQAVYGDDPRFNLWWTFVYPDKRGFDSKCLPKDVYAWRAWADSVGYTADLTTAVLERNQEWLSMNSQS